MDPLWKYSLVGPALFGLWVLARRIPYATGRLLVRSGLLAVYLTPAAVAGHGGAYFGPALLLLLAEPSRDVLGAVSISIAKCWLVLFTLGFCLLVIRLVRSMKKRNPDAKRNV